VWRNEAAGLRTAEVHIVRSLVNEDPRFVREGSYDFAAAEAVEIAGVTVQIPDFEIDAGDYDLLPDSPAIDAGRLEDSPGFDAGGRARPCGEGVDLGAFEFGDCGDAVPFRRGDPNADGLLDLSDAVFTLNFLFLGEREPPCLKSADADDNGSLNVSDPIRVLRHLFFGGEDLPPPFAVCGLDPTADRLACSRHTPCEEEEEGAGL
jgi:hypothetical protein